MKAIVDLARLRQHPNGVLNEYTVDEIALALSISGAAAGQRLHLALDITERLPATLDALQEGQIDLPRARVISEAARVLSAEQATEVEQRVLWNSGCYREPVSRPHPKCARRSDAPCCGSIPTVRTPDTSSGEPNAASSSPAGLRTQHLPTSCRPGRFRPSAGQTCRFPGCRRPAHKCHLDHRIEHPEGPPAPRTSTPLRSSPPTQTPQRLDHRTTRQRRLPMAHSRQPILPHPIRTSHRINPGHHQH
jgi:Domain of unknown function (DUF222)